MHSVTDRLTDRRKDDAIGEKRKLSTGSLQVYNNNNNNNNRICIARVCRMTSEALDGQLQSCYAARARPKMSDGREMFLDYA